MVTEAIIAIMDPSVMLFMLIGVIVGALIGALPGLSVVMAISILTPITFGLEPAQGLAMLIGVYNSGVWAGGISAILVNTPGTPASIMTTLDGYATVSYTHLDVYKRQVCICRSDSGLQSHCSSYNRCFTVS